MLRILLTAFFCSSLIALAGCGGADKGKNKDYDRPKTTEAGVR